MSSDRYARCPRPTPTGHCSVTPSIARCSWRPTTTGASCARAPRSRTSRTCSASPRSCSRWAAARPRRSARCCTTPSRTAAASRCSSASSAEFGADVARIVLANSDSDVEPKPPWCQRKRAYIDAIAHKQPDELRVSLADKLHNARAILLDYRTHGDGLWTASRPAKAARPLVLPRAVRGASTARRDALGAARRSRCSTSWAARSTRSTAWLQRPERCVERRARPHRRGRLVAVDVVVAAEVDRLALDARRARRRSSPRSRPGARRAARTLRAARRRRCAASACAQYSAR